MSHSKKLLSRFSATLLITALSILVLAASGCATTHQHQNHPKQPMVVKPHPNPGKKGKKPHPHSVWMKGHYTYKSGRYLWVPGHWRR
jgi:hypothetical protein